MPWDVSDVGHPALVRLRRGKLALEQIRRNHRRPPTVATGVASIAGVRAQARQAHQPRHAMLATRFAHVVQIVTDLAIAIDTPAGLPALRNQRSDALVISRALGNGLLLPRVVTARMDRQRRTQATHRILHHVGVDEGVPHPDCLAKYAAAFFRMSLSSVTRRNSAFRRRISSAWLSRSARCSAGTP